VTAAKAATEQSIEHNTIERADNPNTMVFFSS
jgi:hypothetical protein